MEQGTIERVALGAVAGLAGTVVSQGLIAAGQKWAPQTLPPMKEEPGKFMIDSLKQRVPAKLRERLSPKVEQLASNSLGLGYGGTFGSLYAISRPKARSILGEGALLGLATWAAGYLGWLPATG